MKGPHERLKYDLRRIWECPDCHRHEWSSGAVTSVFCRCQQKKEAVERVAMKLVEDGPRRQTKEVAAPPASDSAETPKPAEASTPAKTSPPPGGERRSRGRKGKRRRAKGKGPQQDGTQ